MKQSLLMLCILGASLAASSQDKNFDLSNYKFPDYKLHSLEFNFNSDGNSFSRSTDTPSSTGDGSTLKENYLDSRFNSAINLGLGYDNFTRKRIGHIYSTLAGTYGYGKYTSNQMTEKAYGPYGNLILNGYRRYYVKEDKFFLEASTDLNYNYSESKHTYTNSVDQRSKDDYLSLSFGLGGGIGRMEKVSDLWQAYFILEKLKKQNTITRELTDKDIYEFATRASLLKNKRFFDARLRKIGELQSLDTLLHKQGLIENSDMAYFVTLNDYWSYGNFQDRESGRLLKIWIMPEYTRTYSKSVDNTSSLSTTTNLDPNISFNCTKQINLYWERFFNIAFEDIITLDNTGKYAAHYPKNRINTGVQFGFGFYPDSRTSLKLLGGYSGYEGLYYNGEIATKEWANNFNLSLNGVYYVSPQLQLTAVCRLNHNTADHNNETYKIFNYNIGLRYAIF